MKKNVASQTVGAQMISATDGSAFTGAVSCAVTGDAGTQGAGGGAVTHEGNGYHSYAPTQAETNFDHVAFTFTGTGAIPATVQVYTTFPQTGDSFARIGSNGAGLSAVPWNAAWDAEVESEVTDALNAYDPPTNAEMVARTLASASYATPTNITAGTITTVTNLTNAPTAGDFTATMKTSIGTAVAASAVASVTAPVTVGTNNDKTGYALTAAYDAAKTAATQASVDTIDNNVDAILVDTAEIGAAGAGLTVLATAAALATVDSVVDAVKAKTDSLTFTTAGEVDANIQSVNDTPVTGNGQPGTEWGP